MHQTPAACAVSVPKPLALTWPGRGNLHLLLHAGTGFPCRYCSTICTLRPALNHSKGIGSMTSASRPNESSRCIAGAPAGCATSTKPGRCNSAGGLSSDEDEVEEEEDDDELPELSANLRLCAKLWLGAACWLFAYSVLMSILPRHSTTGSG